MDFRLAKSPEDEHHHLTINGQRYENAGITITPTEKVAGYTEHKPILDSEGLIALSSQGLDDALSSEEIEEFVKKLDTWFDGAKTMKPWHWKCTNRDPSERQLTVSNTNFQEFRSACEDSSISVIFVLVRMTSLGFCKNKDGEVHMAVAMIDKNEDEVWFLDPNGRASDRWMAKEKTWFEQSDLMDILTLIFGKWVVYPPCTNQFGPQSLESQLPDTKGVDLTHGYCTSWTLLIIFASLLDIYETPTELFQDLTPEQNRDIVHGWTVWVRREIGLVPLDTTNVRKRVTEKGLDISLFAMVGLGGLLGLFLMVR